MAEVKTKPTSASAAKFLNSLQDPRRREDAKVVLKMMQKVTGKKPRMWGTAIVGFDMYHYKSERSSQQGDWPMAGFSPRQQALTVYVVPGFQKKEAHLLKKLGKHKVSGAACLYIKRLSDVKLPVLEKIVAASYKRMKKKYG